MSEPTSDPKIIHVPSDKFCYPTWEWRGIEDQLLFDIGFAYGTLHEAKTTLKALMMALADLPPNPHNDRLKAHLEELVGKMENFEQKRLNTRDDLYNAGYLAAAKLEREYERNEPSAL